MIKEIQASLNDLNKVVDYLNKTLSSEAIVFLHGDLASGKTTLTQAIAKSKGIHEKVTSPTFSLQQSYIGEDGHRLYHYDLYRLEYNEFMNLGLFEEFEKSGWHMVEWGPDKLKSFLEGVGYNVVIVEIKSTLNGRQYIITT